jgi:hypothetical protein
MSHRKQLEAIQSLVKNASLTWVGNDYKNINWLDDSPQPSEEEVNTEVTRLQAEYDAQLYARNRQYPPLGDQLDDLYHAGVFSAEMTAKLKKVKDDNPK